MTRKTRIDEARLDWDAGAPRSTKFGDVYFSGDGAKEAEHVFLRGNDLPERFSSARRFSIGELGFGTGLNLLLAWDVWRRAAKPAGARLRFFSVEGFPLSRDDLARAHQAWPALAPLSAKLRALYPPPHPGFHRLELDADFTLTLFYGKAATGLEAAEGAIDAWFLDGFAPSKNPDMWSPEVMRELARLSKPGTTFATFTVAGAVRRALDESCFASEKRPGFGRKREMLTGRIDHPPADASRRTPWFDTRDQARLAPGATVAVIGAGVAGAGLAFALNRAGFSPTVYDERAPASGASGNPAGLVMPRLDLDDTPSGRFHDAAYLYTLRLLSALRAQDPAIFNPCGIAQGAADASAKERLDRFFNEQALPPGWIEADAEGVFFPQAGVVSPPRFVRALLGDAPVIKECMRAIDQRGARLIVQTDKGGELEYDAVILANGLEALRFPQARTLPLAGAAGQVDWFCSAAAPERARVFGSYAAPAPEGGLVIGATYEPCTPGECPQPTLAATRANIAAFAGFAPEAAADLDPAASRPRASVRCVTPDQLPVAGPLPDWPHYGAAYDGLRHGRRTGFAKGDSQPGLYILSGLGSRGFVTAPLAAAMIVAEMTGEPAPVDYKVAEALHPARFFIRELKRPHMSEKA